MKRKGHVVEFVDDYLHGVLDTRDAAYVRSHAEQCRICQVALEEAVRRSEALRALPAAEASESLVRAALQEVRATDRGDERKRNRIVYSWVLATAASIAIIGGFHLHYLGLRPTSYDMQVYGQGRLLADSIGSLRVRIFDRAAARPLSDIPVEVELADPERGALFRLAGFTTDGSGSGNPRFMLPDAPDGAYQLRVRARTPHGEEVLTRTVELTRLSKLMLSTDKPVYQPGQTIRMRALALRRPDLRPSVGEEIVFMVKDPRGNLIFKQRDVTSAYGITATDCPIATEVIEGTYTIACQLGDTESRVAVEVKDYVLPKFRIEARLDRPFYQPGDVVRGDLGAHYFFGKPVAGGDIEVVVRTTDVESTVLARLVARTDADGAAVFTYRLPESLIGREPDADDARVTFEFVVRDSAGQEQRRVLSRAVTLNPIRIEVVPEAGRLVTGVTNTVYVFTTYADGRPAQARLAITGFDVELETSALGMAAFQLEPEVDEVRLTMRATDGQGRAGRRHVRLRVGDLLRDFLVRTDRAVYRGGDTVQLTAFGAGVEPVFVDFIRDGQTVLTETVTMTDGRGRHAFDLPPELFGTIEMVAYRFGEAGLPVRKRRVIYVEQARQLEVAAVLDRREYRPGERARIVLQVTDDAGRPSPGAISLAAVDEAVFNVLDQNPGMEQTFFTLEKELLQPVYALYSWMPNLDTSELDPAERNRFEQALFSRTAGVTEGRGAVFDEMLERGMITPGNLEVLDSPDLEQLIDNDRLPQSLVNALRAEQGPHTLAAQSYPEKARRIERVRSRGLENVEGAWYALVVTFATGCIILAALHIRRRWPVVLLLVVGVPSIGSMLIPTLNGSRELAARMVASANLHGLGKAMEILESEKGEASASIRGTDGGMVRVREWFPETLLWRPELITDDQGRVQVDVDLADSITTWRMTASAVAGDGRLGGMNTTIKVFQPFFVDLNLPVALTRGDEVAVPVVIYNYLDQPQTIELTLDTEAGWFELLDEPSKRVELAADEVRSTSFRLRARRVGRHDLRVTARGGDTGDAVKRAVEVVPDGREVAEVFNGTLTEPAQLILDVPTDAIDGSVRATLKLYPSTFSQVLEGLEGIFQRPFGCFEQTSSVTYPNVLALDYLRRTKQQAPDVEALARQYIHLGYQRLLGFEVDGGGFEWFGRSPANRTLTAYGLMEFEDMARVHDVDPQLIRRTRRWLMAQRNGDGSWSPESHTMRSNLTRGADARLSTTAYIAWAVFRGRGDALEAGATQDYLLGRSPRSIRDPYVLALVCNALLAIDSNDPAVRPYLDQLVALKRADADSRYVWWEQAAGRRTTFYGAGLSGDIETTALSTLALLASGRNNADARAALTWLVAQKDRLGTWHSTQATVLAFKALLAGSGRPLGGDETCVVRLAINADHQRQLVITPDQAEVMRQVALGPNLRPGRNTVTLREPTGTGVGYQLDFSYHVGHGEAATSERSLDIELQYDRSTLAVGDTSAVSAVVRNNTGRVLPMVVLDLPVPAGFAADARSFDDLVRQGVIAKYQITARSIVVYLRLLAPDKPLVLQYRLSATMPVRVTVSPARAYEYYDPAQIADSGPATLVVVDSAGG